MRATILMELLTQSWFSPEPTLWQNGQLMFARAVVCATAVLACASGAFGQVPDPRETRARKDCLSGRVESGVALLAEVFIDTKNPNLIYNQARCFEQNGRGAEAITRFREYLRLAKNLTAEEKSEVDRHIADCRAMQEEQKSAVAPSQPPPEVPAAASPAPTQPGPPTVSATGPLLAQPAPLPSSGSGLRVAGLVIAGVGVAGIVAGIALNLKANSLGNSIKPPNLYDRDTESTRRDYETWSWVGYGVGAAGMVTGAILLGIAWGSRKNSEQLALIPAIQPSFAGAALRGAF